MNTIFYKKIILMSVCTIFCFFSAPLNAPLYIMQNALTDVKGTTPRNLQNTYGKAHAADNVSAKTAPNINDQELKKALIKLLQDEPEIIFNILEENSEELIQVITLASEKARTSKLKAGWKKDLKTPKKMDTENRPRLGKNNAKNTIIGYSDFLCSYCAQAASTVHTLINKRNDTKFIFKSIPNSDTSKIATRWFYHINQKDSKKAWQFHDALFANQQALAQKPRAVVKGIAKQLGFDAESMEKDISKNQKKLDAIIDADVKEAKKLNFSGTPYFVVNNAVIRGSYPVQSFEDAIEFTNKNK